LKLKKKNPLLKSQALFIGYQHLVKFHQKKITRCDLLVIGQNNFAPNTRKKSIEHK
jgi:5'(3')-deoxyribonucleotidase